MRLCGVSWSISGFQKGLEQGDERRRGITIGDAQSGPIGPLDFHFRRGRAPRCRDFHKVGTEEAGVARACCSTRRGAFERLGSQAQMVGDPGDR